MKYSLITLIIILFSACNVSAQKLGPSDVYNEILMSPFYNFYSQNNLSAISCGMGLTGIAGNNDISGISLNPASLDLQSKYEIKAEYSYRNNVSWLTSLGFNDMFLKQNHPAGAVLFGYKINEKFQTGFNYRNDINYKFDFGYSYLYNEQGQIIDSQDVYQSFNTHTFSIPLVYKYKFFKAGINLNYILYTAHEIFTTMNTPDHVLELNTTFGRFVPDFGILITPVPELTFGLTYTQGYDKTIVREWSSVIENTRNDTTIAHYPSRLGFGAALKLFNGKLLLEADYRFENTSKTYILKDRNDIFFGADYSIDKNWNLRTGFFTLFDYRDVSGNYIDPAGTYDQYFLTFGAGYKYNGFGFDFSFMNSTIFSNSKVGHSKLNGSLSYSF